MSREIVGFAPSLVDISIRLSEAQYKQCCNMLDVEPGGWKRIDSFEAAKNLLTFITGTPIARNDLLEALQQKSGISVAVGSSVLGMLAAMRPELRGNSTLITVLAEKNGELDPLSKFFTDSVQRINLQHEAKLVQGHNPTGFVISSDANPEKTLAMHPGVAGELEDYDLDRLNPSLVMIDAYELQNSKLGVYLDSVIHSGDYRIALSLGNHTTLQGTLREQLRAYMVNGKIDILCGNRLEYQRLYPDVDDNLLTKEGFSEHPVQNHAPYALLTLGAEGVVAHWGGETVYSPAYTLDQAKIVNTSGAGDVTAGVFCAGLLAGDSGKETLQKAAYMATKVLKVLGSMLVASS